jgi:DNA repair exonuclease SbcCD ATPase subunit
MTQEQKQKLIEKTKEALKLAIQSSIKHSKNVAKSQNHISDLIKFHKEDRATIQRLNAVIDMKQREIDKVNKENIDILWKMAKLEKEVIECKQYKQVASEVAEYEKKMTEYMDSKKVDN